MPYEYLDDAVTSDITFRACGRDINDLFRAAADATTNTMVASLDTIKPEVARTVSVDADALDLLLMRFLDELVYYKDAEGLLLRAVEVRVQQIDHIHRAAGELRGQPLNPDTHDLVADVKAVTLHGLHVKRTAAGWEAQVTLDV